MKIKNVTFSVGNSKNCVVSSSGVALEASDNEVTNHYSLYQI